MNNKKNELKTRKLLPKCKPLSNLGQPAGGAAGPGYQTMPCPQTAILCPAPVSNKCHMSFGQC